MPLVEPRSIDQSYIIFSQSLASRIFNRKPWVSAPDQNVRTYGIERERERLFFELYTVTQILFKTSDFWVSNIGYSPRYSLGLISVELCFNYANELVRVSNFPALVLPRLAGIIPKLRYDDGKIAAAPHSCFQPFIHSRDEEAFDFAKCHCVALNAPVPASE